MDPSTRDDLKKLVIEQKKVSLPFEAPDPALEALHQAIVEYDGLVSLLVIGAIQDAPVEVPTERLQALRTQLDQMLALPEVQAARQVTLYRAYRDRLDRLYELASR